MAGAWPEIEDVDEFLKETYKGRGWREIVMDAVLLATELSVFF